MRPGCAAWATFGPRPVLTFKFEPPRDGLLLRVDAPGGARQYGDSDGLTAAASAWLVLVLCHAMTRDHGLG